MATRTTFTRTAHPSPLVDVLTADVDLDLFFDLAPQGEDDVEASPPGSLRGSPWQAGSLWPAQPGRGVH